MNSTLKIFRRNVTSLYKNVKLKDDHEFNTKGRIKSWAIDSYGDINELKPQTTRLPIMSSPNDVLVKVEAASVNPIDLLMLRGYGRTLFQLPRGFEIELPLVLGRDFAGTIISKGHNVTDSLKIGDAVYGFLPLHQQGSFRELVVADKHHLHHRPAHLTPVECTSLCYATMTAWGALFVTGNLQFKDPLGKKILILGASGGVGTLAVQLLKSQHCHVFATCSEDATTLLKSLGADQVFDYRDHDFEQSVASVGSFDIILDCAKIGYDNLPKSWSYKSYITLNSPLLFNTDQYGLLGGLVESSKTLLSQNYGFLKSCQRSVKWGFFVPSASGFSFVHELIRAQKIRPVVHKTFKFEELPEAFKTVRDGHLRGKVVIDFS